MKAEVHPRQEERLDALSDYSILDTERESAFDELADLASKICETPIAVVNLIDATRQWFKAEVGLGVRETPLETSICSHVILENDFVEIPDTLDDRRMTDNPLCNGESGLRFYAGAVLKTDEELPLGTLCVLDYSPRQLNDLQKQALRVLAKQVMTQLDLRRALKNEQLLRKEADHRVKNSLQTVSSLLRLQKNNAHHPDASLALDAAHRRIEAVSALHQELYSAGSSNSIDLARYMAKVGHVVRRSCPPNIKLSLHFEDVSLSAEQASAIAVILNEFVTNSMKHGFRDGQDGTVSVTGRHAEDGRYEIGFADDGIGISVSTGDTGTAGLGSKIMQASATHLGAELQNVPSEQGVHSLIRFKPKTGTQTPLP